MLLNLLVSRIAFNLSIISLLALSFYTFGYAAYFDRLFIGFLLCVALFTKNNANLISVVVIFLIERLLEEVIFSISSFAVVKPVIYLFSLSIVYIVRYDYLAKAICLPIILVCLFVEVFWYLTDYNAPRIHTYVGMMTLNLITRHFIVFRIFIFSPYFVQPLSSKPVDWPLYQVARLNVFAVAAILLEYLIRHLTVGSPTMVYNSYPYIMHALSLATLTFIMYFMLFTPKKFIA